MREKNVFFQVTFVFSLDGRKYFAPLENRYAVIPSARTFVHTALQPALGPDK